MFHRFPDELGTEACLVRSTTFGYRESPIGSFLERAGMRVLYAGTFSKELYPGLRLAYLVVPEQQIAAFRETVGWLGTSSQALLQAAVAEFMEQGHFSRHLKRMRTLYAARRTWLIDALEKVSGESPSIPPRAGGLHVLTYWQTDIDERAVAVSAQAQSLTLRHVAWLHQSDLIPTSFVPGPTPLPGNSRRVLSVHKRPGSVAM